MSTQTVIVVGVVAVAGIALFYVWNKNQSQLQLSGRGISGTINVGQAISATSGLVTALSNAFGGGSAGYTDTQNS